VVGAPPVPPFGSDDAPAAGAFVPAARAAPDAMGCAALQLHEINASAMPVVKPLLIDLMLAVLMLSGRYARSRPAIRHPIRLTTARFAQRTMPLMAAGPSRLASVLPAARGTDQT
jgi:hypothetical protein